MKTRPIPMSAPMMKAYLAGRKNQTRRVIPPILTTRGKVLLSDLPIEQVIRVGPWFHFEGKNQHNDPVMWTVKCPYGVPGDTLWFKETWTAFFEDDEGMLLPYQGVLREHRTKERLVDEVSYRADKDDWDSDFKPLWVSSRFMPRWAARVVDVPILSIRAERVQDITVEDAMNEGLWDGYTFTSSGEWYRQKYAELWDHLNAKRGYPWKDNGWVWRIEFPFYGQREEILDDILKEEQVQDELRQMEREEYERCQLP